MLRKIFQNKLLYIFCLLLLFLLFRSQYLFPSDVLNYIPAFSQNSWERPHNSLLADPVYQFEPWRHFAKEKILKGEFPLWNDLNGGGAPFFANPQTAVLFPLNIAYYVFPLSISLNLIPLLKTFLFFLFTYLYIRKLGITKFSAAISAVTASMSGFFAVWLLWPHTNVLLFFPALLLLTENLKNKEKPIYFVFISLAYCAAIFGGHPETLFYVTIIHLMYSFVRIKKLFVKLFLSIVLGFSLGAVQLLPFLEYLLNSYVFAHRTTTALHNSLPIQSVFTNIFPFIFGAPHTLFYKSVFPYSNFQEYIGAYVGAIPLVFVFFGINKFREQIYKFWGTAVLICLAASYGILPLDKLPVLNISANHRLIGFAGFGLIVLFSRVLDLVLSHKIRITFFERIPTGFVKVLAVLLFVIVFSSFPNKSVTGYYAFFVSLVLLSSILFLYVLKQNKKVKQTLLFLALFIQTGFLFITYVPLTNSKNYYPTTPLIKKLHDLPRGRILEVGNPSLYKNINLMYGFESAQNDDAIEVGTYRRLFDKTFPLQNQWGIPDTITPEGLNNFGIEYVISDYNINYVSERLQSKDEKIVKLEEGKEILARFVASDKTLKQVRVLTANYNRLNTCKLKFELINFPSATAYSDCKQIRDHMFFTISLPNISLINGKEYVLKISSPEGSINNSIGIWTNKESVPYVELLYENKEVYPLLYSDISSYLFEVPKSNIISYGGKYSIVANNTNKIVVKTESDKADLLKVNKTYYPGWTATINGVLSEVKKEGSFMGVLIGPGRNIVELVYIPITFIIGLGISAISFMFIVFILLRNEKWSRKFDARWRNWVDLVNKHVAWPEHFLKFGMFFLISVAVFALLSSVLHFKFVPAQTSAINWLTVNHYPKQQDYFYFIIGFIAIFVATILQWITWIVWRSKK